ncbi:MAG: right-handed parallel beta-helix repeat-containing protein [archaeon]
MTNKKQNYDNEAGFSGKKGFGGFLSALCAIFAILALMIAPAMATPVPGPFIFPVGISSDNQNPLYAQVGDNVTLRFSSDQLLNETTTEVTIAGHSVPIVQEIANQGTAIGFSYVSQYAMQSSDAEGIVPFSIYPYALPLVSSLLVQTYPVTTTTDGSSVTFDMTAPTFEQVGINSDFSGNSSFARPWTYVYVKAAGSSEEFTLGTFTIEGRLASVGGALRIDPEIDGFIQMYPEDPAGIVPFEFTVTDTAGNSATFTEENTTDSSFVHYDNRPSSVYVSKEYCDPNTQVTPDVLEQGPCGNDGHTWGYDAFNAVQAGVDAMFPAGSVYVVDNETYDEAVIMSKPGTIYGTDGGAVCGTAEICSLESEGSENLMTKISSVKIDDPETAFYWISTPYVIVTPKATISEGTTLVDEHGTVELTEGTWRESVLIQKHLRLIGAGVDNSIISVLPGENGISIYSGNATIEGLSILQFKGLDIIEPFSISAEFEETSSEGSGIYSSESDNIVLRNVKISYFAKGLDLHDGTNFEIYGNEISSNGVRKDDRSGIDLYEMSEVKIHDNTIDSNNVGIYSADSTGVVVEKNKIIDNELLGAEAEGEVIKAWRNWWGTASFAEIIGNVSGKVDFSFWCLDETCTTFAKPIETTTENLDLLNEFGLFETFAAGQGHLVGYNYPINGWTAQNTAFAVAPDGTIYKGYEDNLYTLDPLTGAESFKVQLNDLNDSSIIRPYAFAFDGNGILYMAAHGHVPSPCNDYLATVDTTTGDVSQIAKISYGDEYWYGGMNAIAFAPDGTFYGVKGSSTPQNSGSRLYTINKETGELTFVAIIQELFGEVENAEIQTGREFFTQGLAFSPSGILYGSGDTEGSSSDSVALGAGIGAMDSSSDGSIYKIDPSNGNVTFLSYTNPDTGYPGGMCFELSFSPEGKLYCYNYGSSDGPALVRVAGTTVFTNLAIGSGDSYAYPEDGTEITRGDGLPVDIRDFTADIFSFSASGLPANYSSVGAFQWGIVGQGLYFSPSMQISIYVGPAHNGGTLSIFRSLSPSGGRTQDGILDPTTCIVADGYCTFRATKASYYAAAAYSPPAPPVRGSGGSGGAPAETCRPDFALSAPADVETSTDFAEILVTLSVNGTCADYGTDITSSAPEGWRVDIGSTGLLKSGEEQTLTATVLVPEGADGTVQFTARIGGIDYTASTRVKSTKGAGSQGQPGQEEQQPEITTTVPTTTTIAPQQPPVGQTGFFTGLFGAFQNFWNWLTGLF